MQFVKITNVPISAPSYVIILKYLIDNIVSVYISFLFVHSKHLMKNFVSFPPVHPF